MIFHPTLGLAVGNLAVDAIADFWRYWREVGHVILSK